MFQIKATIFNNGGLVSAIWPDVVHLWVVLDRDPDPAAATVPAWNEIFRTDSNAENAHVNLNNTHRFRVMKHIEVKMSPPVYHDAYNQTNNVATDLNVAEWYTALNTEVGYHSTSTFNSWKDITKNNILVYASATRCGGYFLTYRTRVRYTDD